MEGKKLVRLESVNCFFISLFEWTPLGRKVSIPSLAIFLTVMGWMPAPFQINPMNRTNIPASQISSILTPHNSCNMIPLMRKTKQARIWSDSKGSSSHPEIPLSRQLGLQRVHGLPVEIEIYMNFFLVQVDKTLKGLKLTTT